MPAFNRLKPSPAETLRLIARYRETGDMAARDAVAEAYLYIAEIIARRFSGRGVDYDDLYQVAALALVRALERFDPARGVQFDSYATPAMVGEVRNYFRDKSRLIRPARGSAEALRRVARLTAELTQSLGRSPRVDELAEAAGLGEAGVLELLEMSAPPVSLNQTPSEDDAGDLLNIFGTEETGFSAFETRDMLARALAQLTERERQVVQLRFFENLSQREAAGRLNISQMTVSRAEQSALRALRALITDERQDG